VKLYQRRDVNETLSSILQNYPKTRKSIDKETVFASSTPVLLLFYRVLQLWLGSSEYNF